ncbi:DcrB-related protein [Pseudomonas sp. MH2]|uniref:DcrB-related protein n=1 Tax=Pseudomonas machongensis TaxID=3110229 RepID=A0ABU5VG24_9PSED|nr:DcrB-related protein [Pseudomonas sp. MH2]MEA5672310.1 DcrB-related protein [Pseudomonas sp. MH2]
MQYSINEALLCLPDTKVIDASINILRFPDLGTTLIISRSPLAENETLKSNFDAQLDKLRQQVANLRCSPAQETKAGVSPSVDAIEVQTEFNKGNERVYQYQIALQVPGKAQLIALSYVASKPMTSVQTQHWTVIKQSLQLLEHS